MSSSFFARPTMALMAEKAERFFEGELRRVEREYKAEHDARFPRAKPKERKPSYEQRVRAKLAQKGGRK